MTITTAVRRKAARSTVALKALMAVTGLIMIAYLLAHMYGNLKIFTGQQGFDNYAEHLRTIGEPVLPRSGFLWVVRIVLIASVLGHIYAALTLWWRADRARGGIHRYQSPNARRGVQRTYASFTLRWGGVIIVLFVIYHLLHLTADVIAPGGPSPSPYQRMVNGFQVWWVVLSYTIAMIAIGLHIRHGTWSALTTLGANTSAVARRRLNQLAYLVAFVITIGFLIPPFVILFGWVK